MRTKNLVLLCLLLFAGVRGFAAKVEIGGLYYNLTVSSKTAELTSPTSGKYSNINVDIPMSVSYNNATYSVTSIGSSAFNGCTNLTGITIPNSVMTIGDYAFSRCSNLERVTIGYSVMSIGQSAFYECSNLTKVIVENIGGWCTMTFGDIYSNPLHYAHHIYSDEETEITDLEIPKSLASFICDRAFEGCSSLVSVTIPNTVSYIGNNAFNGCTSLENIEFDGFYNAMRSGTKRIESAAFKGCSSLTSVSIPLSVVEIGDEAFNSCFALTKVIIGDGDGVGKVGATTIGESAFAYCSSLADLTIGNIVYSIGKKAFYDCKSLTVVTIPETITSIGDEAFQNCYIMEEVICRANTIPSCGENAFYINKYSTNHLAIYVPVDKLSEYQSSNGWNVYNDYITDHISITVCSTGYVTYCSHADLDFSEISDYQACIIEKYYKTDESYVVPTPVDKMQYGIGFLLIGKANTTCSVPFVINTEKYDTNLLIGTLTSQELPQATDDGKTNYILANGSKGIGFYKSSGNGYVAAHKAYLHLSEEDAANINMLLIGGNGNTTGIEQTIQETMPQHNEIYNLNGQRVENPQHGGIYIVGGKKIIY